MIPRESSYVVFVGTRRVARGPLEHAVEAAKRRHDAGATERIALFDERTGGPLDLNLDREVPEIVARLQERLCPAPDEKPPAARGRGRPKLGVVSREISLLPRHWAWLGAQRGGASAEVRRLVDQARKRDAGDGEIREAIEAAHRFLWDMAGGQPGFEHATRALFARDFPEFERRIARWPVGIREQLQRLLEHRTTTPAEGL